MQWSCGWSFNACCCNFSQILEESINFERSTQLQMEWKITSNIEKSIESQFKIASRPNQRFLAVTMVTLSLALSVPVQPVKCKGRFAEGGNSRQADSIMTTLTKWLLTRKRNLLVYVIETEAISCHHTLLAAEIATFSRMHMHLKLWKYF